MKINFEDYDLTEFAIKEGVFGGLWSKLITPIHIGTKFTQKNKIFRSSIWSTDGELISAGLPKFVNFSENPENFPVPLSINNCAFVEKIDGSLCCIDYINGQVCMRTRGTLSYTSLENAPDFEYCLAQHPLIIEWLKTNSHCTILCELTTPNLKIVLSYGQTPQLWLVGVVNKNDYSLMPQNELDALGVELGIPRPNSFSFDTIEQLLAEVSKWIGREGICLYSKNGQEIHKIKAEAYLRLHRMKSELSSVEKVIDVWISRGYPSYTDFYNYIQTTFDYELAEYCRGNISNICDGYKEVKQIIAHMTAFIEPLKSLPRKDAAMKIIAAYGETNRKSFCFNLLDGKELDGEAIKKLMFQVLKKTT
jgi:hypothetical protein